MPTRLERQLDAAFEAVATDHSFGRVQHRLDLVGLCATCASVQAG